ncbi:hypothetical protein Y032_0332g2760 [Ancylostoma ceylanicum]|uniref:Uncharacterized protein n=1 Tax=Ancylostoma ceylanicum TaxID=53326 RepID=A0A016RZ17_9BILA|nr:hypothetical protein Y032_0332g2760 [Ancylostoma ceylanicum]
MFQLSFLQGKELFIETRLPKLLKTTPYIHLSLRTEYPRIIETLSINECCHKTITITANYKERKPDRGHVYSAHNYPTDATMQPPHFANNLTSDATTQSDDDSSKQNELAASIQDDQ